MPQHVHDSSSTKPSVERQLMLKFEDSRSGTAPSIVDLGPKHFDTRTKCTEGIVSVTVEEIVANLILLQPSILSCE